MNYEIENCVYDNRPCYGDCENCQYGYNKCLVCGVYYSYPERLNGKRLCEKV